MAQAKGLNWGRIRGVWAHVHSLGGRNANDPTHHGTPDQRLAATYLGVQLAKWQAQGGGYMSYRQMHAFLIPQLRRIVATTR
jgi:hypothetical protein